MTGVPEDPNSRTRLERSARIRAPNVLKQRWREWLAIAAISFSLAFAYSFANKFRRNLRGERVDWGTIPVEQILHFSVWVLLYPCVAFMAVRFPLGDKRPQNVVAHVLGALVFSPLLMTLTALLHATAMRERAMEWAALVRQVIVPEYAWGMTVYVVLLSVAHALEFRRRGEERAMQTARLEAALAHTRLQVLRTQLEPHFLFNALNSISSLVRRNPDAAERMVARLGDFLRLTLDDSMPQEVTLGRELEFLQRYLDIERVRFRDRLTVAIDAPVELHDARVPYLILQPIVENAVRHGIAARAGAGRIEVRASTAKDRLCLAVEDDGAGAADEAASSRTGIGLANIRARLEQLYGTEASVTIDSRPSRGSRVTVLLPLHRGAGLEVAPAPRS